MILDTRYITLSFFSVAFYGAGHINGYVVILILLAAFPVVLKLPRWRDLF